MALTKADAQLMALRQTNELVRRELEADIGLLEHTNPYDLADMRDRVCEVVLSLKQIVDFKLGSKLDG